MGKILIFVYYIAMKQTPATFRQYLNQLAAQRAAQSADSQAGFFGPETIVWQVNRERINYLGGLRAILMQLAHPAVAQGVADHSNFQQDPMGRFVRTMSVVQDILFGPTDVAVKAATRVYAKHARVRGVLHEEGLSGASFDCAGYMCGRASDEVPLRSGCGGVEEEGLAGASFDCAGHRADRALDTMPLRSGCGYAGHGTGRETREMPLRSENGGMEERGGHFEYHALDPDLLVWVYATLIDSLMFIHDEILPPLGEARWGQLYEEGKPFAYLFGIPDSALPPTLDDFHQYVAGMVNSLTVTPTAREMAQVVIRSPHPVFGLSNSILAAGTLPTRLRTEFGLPWNGAVRAGYRMGIGALRVVVPLLPTRLRTHAVNGESDPIARLKGYFLKKHTPSKPREAVEILSE